MRGAGRGLRGGGRCPAVGRSGRERPRDGWRERQIIVNKVGEKFAAEGRAAGHDGNCAACDPVQTAGSDTFSGCFYISQGCFILFSIIIRVCVYYVLFFSGLFREISRDYRGSPLPPCSARRAASLRQRLGLRGEPLKEAQQRAH